MFSPDLPKLGMGNVVSSHEIIDDVLVASISELHDDVVDDCRNSRIVDERETKSMALLVSVRTLCQSDNRVCAERIEDRCDRAPSGRRAASQVPELKHWRQRSSRDSGQDSGVEAEPEARLVAWRYPQCLALWKPTETKVTLPKTDMVGNGDRNSLSRPGGGRPQREAGAGRGVHGRIQNGRGHHCFRFGVRWSRTTQVRGKRPPVLLLVYWDSVASHEAGFRRSAEYQEWKQLLHHFYEPFPTVEHYLALA